ncbi:MAG: phage virion morphogenesis protein [Alphaproteobacteria bacterium]|nr:phage virion morphogenesis protein [Alphaproteobacteria bacterium]
MAGVSARIDVTTDEIGPVLRRLVDAGEDLTPAMDQIGGAMVSSTMDRFEREEGPDGRPWEKSARALADGGRTLTDRGNLVGFLTHRVLGDAVEWGSNLVYAAIHQLGGTIRAKAAKALAFRIGDAFVYVQSVTLPARPYLGLDGDDEAEILEILADHFAGAAPAPGGGGPR